MSGSRKNPVWQRMTQWTDGAPPGAVEEMVDVVIVGTGVGGATAARVLSEAGLDVMLIEEGPHVFNEDLRSDMYTAFKNNWRDMGFQVAEGRAFIPVLQGRCVGGTTAVNGAIIHRMPEPIHRIWQREWGLGEALPYERMQQIYDRMDAELHVGTAPDDVLGNNSALMERGVEALGITGNRIRRNVKDCRGSVHCNQGCPTGRRQSMNNSYVPLSLEQGARLLATCKVTQLVERGGRAAGVRGHFQHPHTAEVGSSVTVHARHGVIVAASAIQTPLLLADNGVGRGSRLVGQRFQSHPGAGLVGVFDEPVNMWFGATQGYETTHYWDERMKFETVGMPLELTTARLPAIGPALMRDLKGAAHLAVWGVQVRAGAMGSVGRSWLGGRTVIKYDPSDEDVRVLKRGLKRVSDMMFAAGAREVMPGVHGMPERISSPEQFDAVFSLPDDPRLFHWIAAHLFGTVCMGGPDHRTPLGPDGQSRDLPGLYVMDASVFPTNMGVNPQHTIGAISWLLAERFAESVARAA